MKHETAFKLIGDQLDWTDADFAKEFRELQLMIDYKYDSYQGFQPGTRFHVALLNWLSQFECRQDKRTAYEFIKSRLVYVSQREMHHLVGLMMPIIERCARQRVASELQIPLHLTHIETSAIDRLRILRRRTLYVGLSDGARIDVFRRYNEGKVSNEQVVAFSEITKHKWEDLQKELTKSLHQQFGLSLDESVAASTFEAICLVDDFSGSGSSLLRFDEKSGSWKGKIKKFYDSTVPYIGAYVSPNSILHVHHHLASKKAQAQISSDVALFQGAHTLLELKTSFSHVLSADIVIHDECGADALSSLIKEHYDIGIEDEHTGENIWYGYKQCGLPLILEHNTPNNSVALLWAESDKSSATRMKPLFTRRKRHSSHG
jgi:hypothetical protein